MLVHDESNVPEFLRMLKELYNTKIEIGIMGDGKGSDEYDSDSPITVLGVATIHEFGAPSVNIPERSFIRATFDSKKDEIEKKTEKILEDVIHLRLDVNSFYETMGEYLVGLVQEYLTNLSDPPNKDITITMKGSSNPLIDTGQLKDSITYRVVEV